MPRLKLLGGFALMVAMSAMQVRAAATTLPPDVIAADTAMVIHLDNSHFNPDQIQSAATAILGPNANKFDEPLKEFKAKYDKAATAGAQAITVVISAPKKADAAGAAPADDAGQRPEPNGIMYIQLKAGADVKALETLLTADMDQAHKDKTVFEQADNFLAVHEKSQAFPVKPDAVRAALFADALGTVSDAAIQIAIIPDAAMRDRMLKNTDEAPKPVKDALPLIAKSKWLTLAISLGNAPGLTGTASAATDADAKTISDDLTAAIADVKGQIAKPDPNGNPIIAMAAPLIGPLLDGLKPTQAGTQVSVSIKTDALKTIAGFAANFGLLGPGAGRRAPQ